MIDYLAVILFTFLVGIFLGATGIGGFLIPIFLIGVLGFGVAETYSMSFLAFTAAGALGAWFYWKADELYVRTAILLSIGSFPGAIAGVLLNRIIPTSVATGVLYSFIILSSLYSLLKNREPGSAAGDGSRGQVLPATLLIPIGFGSALFCTFAGAGGPVLVIPILLLLHVDARKAIGIALFDSVFVGIPASIGYGLSSGYVVSMMGVVGAVAVLIGVRVGTAFVSRIRQEVTRDFILVLASAASVFLLVRQLV